VAELREIRPRQALSKGGFCDGKDARVKGMSECSEPMDERDFVLLTVAEQIANLKLPACGRA
jgi:hypothetical protein